MTRRGFLWACAATGFAVRVPALQRVRRPVRAAVIADLHYGFAPDAGDRFAAFESAVRQDNRCDVAIQLGDFCHSDAEAEPFARHWKEFGVPKLDVLGNHDMDKGTKAQIMATWGMPARFGAYTFGSIRFVVLDLNHFRKGEEMVEYASGNFYQGGISHNWADAEQMDWLVAELRRGDRPTVLLGHQPIGFAEPGKPLPPEQAEILKIARDARRENPDGAVVACLSGHLHVDRAEVHEGIVCVSLNSASYFWHDGMHPYRDPLFAFVEFDPSGFLRIQGRSSGFAKSPPDSKVRGMRARISDRRLDLPVGA